MLNGYKIIQYTYYCNIITIFKKVHKSGSSYFVTLPFEHDIYQ